MLSILFDGESTQERVAEGRVEDMIHCGDRTYYQVGLDGAPGNVTISMKNRAGRPMLERGVRTRVSHDPRALAVFPADAD